jgi:hypothetical protein
MRKFGSFLCLLGIFVCLLLGTERRAYAYVDPGSGLLIFQGISSTFLGALYFFRRKLKFGRRKAGGTEQAQDKA